MAALAARYAMQGAAQEIRGPPETSKGNECHDWDRIKGPPGCEIKLWSLDAEVRTRSEEKDNKIVAIGNRN